MEVGLLEDKELKENELHFTLNQFFKMLYVDFGLRVNRSIKEWYKMSWDEFKEELSRNKIRMSDCLLNDWETYFNRQKQKVLALMK